MRILHDVKLLLANIAQDGRASDAARLRAALAFSKLQIAESILRDVGGDAANATIDTSDLAAMVNSAGLNGYDDD